MAFIDQLDEGVIRLKADLNTANQKARTAKTEIEAEKYLSEVHQITDEIRRVEQYRRDNERIKKGLD